MNSVFSVFKEFVSLNNMIIIQFQYRCGHFIYGSFHIRLTRGERFTGRKLLALKVKVNARRVWKRPDCARGSLKFHYFRINDPAILIQSSYFITYFKESKSTKKKISIGAKFEEKKTILRLFLYFCMLKNI